MKWIPKGLIASTQLAISEVVSTLKDIKSFNTLFLYMIAYFCFIDGINSVTALSGVFGNIGFGLTIFGLILTIMIIQFVAAPAAIGFTKLASKLGNKEGFAIFTCLLVFCNHRRSFICPS